MQQEKVFQAIEFAARAHRGQFRKGSDLPYIFHPLSVAKILINCGASEEMVVAGILHDTVVDTDVALADIERAFGAEVALLVEGASEPDKSAPWMDRKQHTIDHLRTASPDPVLLVCADKLDNILSTREEYARLGESLWERFNKPREDQKWYYQSLVQVLGDRMIEDLAASLFRQFEEEVRRVFGDGEEV